jgi:hypothetical protein
MSGRSSSADTAASSSSRPISADTAPGRCAVGGRGCRVGRLEIRILAQDALLEAAELGGRLETELVERVPRIPVGSERVSLPSGAIGREHALGVEALAVRVRSGQGFQLARQRVVASGVEIRLDSRLERREARVLEARRVRVSERLAGDVREGSPARERQRLNGLRLAHEPLEALDVELPGLDTEQ